jgi:hypothetical protein
MTPEVRSRSSASEVHSRGLGIAFLLFTLAPLACVNLSKPGSVEECAKNSSCSDNSKLPGPEPGPDAALSDVPPMPDLATPDAAPDLPSDPQAANPDGTSVPDMPPDGRNDSRANDIVQIVDDGGSDLIGTNDQVLGPDLGLDLRSDIADLAPELGLELAPESGPELGPELGPEPGRDPGREQGPEPVAEPVPEPTPEPGRDGGDSGSVNCISQLISNNYAAGTSPPCSVCSENGTSKAAQCTAMIDCLAPPKTQASILDCQHSVVADSVVADCVSALTTAACPTGF